MPKNIQPGINLTTLCLWALICCTRVLAQEDSAAITTGNEFFLFNLKPHFTAKLTNSINSPESVKENNLAALPSGIQIFSEIPFQVEGLVQLSGKKILEWGRNEFPQAVKGIKVVRKAQKIHLLHGAGGVFDRYGTPIASLVLHYSDGTELEFRILSGIHVLDWWGSPGQRVSGENSELAWTGSNPALMKFGSHGALRIYKTTFENPHPEKRIETMDYVSKMNESSPFVLGLTFQRTP